LIDRVDTGSSILSNGVKERPTSPLRSPCESDDHSLPSRNHQLNDSGNAQKKVYGRHGDINPSNILWYDDGDGDDDGCTLRGTLKITDFGQAEIHSLQSKTDRRERPNTMTYRPPECDLPDAYMRQSYDIWCLGCVYLEFVTWLLGGRELVKRFKRSRMMTDYFARFTTIDTFYEVEKDPELPGIRAKVNPRVTAVRYILRRHSALLTICNSSSMSYIDTQTARFTCTMY
jgi:serine/threonine protein kinase